MKLAVIIGVEEYADSNIARRAFAATDTTAFGLVIRALGFEEADQLLLVDAQATKTTIESKLRRTFRSLAVEDELLLYYAGHGFAEAGRGYLTCHDTQATDLAATSIAWRTVLKQLSESDCRHVALLIDSCRGAKGSSLGDDPLVYDEFEAFCAAEEGRACFVACQAGETSWPAAQVKHSAWGANVVTAFAGQDKSALNSANLLTSTSLQTYLVEAVPRTLQRAYSDQKQQTPVSYGPVSGNFVLADLGEILAKRKDSATAHLSDVHRVTLWRENIEGIRSLAGFKKTQAVPDAVNSYARALVTQLAASEIEQDIGEIRDKLRQEFSFKRRDLEATIPGDGTGSILTPYFCYSVTVSLNPANPAEVIWRRQVAEIKEPEQILSPAFELVFPKKFSAVEFSPPVPINLADFIDQLEETGDQRVKLDYDSAATWCKLTIKGIPGQIAISPTNFAIVHPRAESPRLLLDAFFKIQAMLVDTYDVRAVGFRRD
ncbi:Caspase domain protein [Anatilimnocola aggregata]|uniref:Caspase domain protein n=1 Tax=Anatilimnocola aggregata TaxID=2528021 RepID=A0A517YNF5_9BACT|nr:caspase family protein [Anatilimnocola aggregata]QDU31744.1 Caspase domain protein [Anatilimnocola aggregata]